VGGDARPVNVQWPTYPLEAGMSATVSWG